MNNIKLLQFLTRTRTYCGTYVKHPSCVQLSFKRDVQTSVSMSQNTKEKEVFLQVLPGILDNLQASSKISQLPEVGCWIRKVLERNLKGGKQLRGLTTILSYEMLEKPDQITDEKLKLARVLGWCVEMSLLYASMGQHLDLTTAKQLKDYSLFTIDRYDSIVKYKASYYTYTLPVLLGLSLVNDMDESIGGHVNDICTKLGYLLQIQDDYIDCYGKESVTGKAGTDIQEAKCSWLAVTALQRCNESQKDLFTQFYGSKEPGHVEIIKRLYDELRLPELFRQEEKVVHDDIILKVRALPSETGPTFFFKLIDSIYKRKH